MGYWRAIPNLDAELEDLADRQHAAWELARLDRKTALVEAAVKDTLRAERDKMLVEFDWGRYADQKYLAAFFRRWPDISKYLSVGE